MATTENVSFAWKRPSGPPRVWKRFEVNEKTGSEGKDGKVFKFSIEEIPSDRHNEVIDLLVNNFVADDPLCRYTFVSLSTQMHILKGIEEDPNAIEDFRQCWKLLLNQGISVVLFLDDSDVDKREIVGANLLLVLKHEEEELLNKLKLKSVGVGTIIYFLTRATLEASVLDHYKVDKYISALGHFVISRFRGYSLGDHILGVRNDIGREYKIPVTGTAFTDTASQILAQRNGFEVLVVERYLEAYTRDGFLLFPTPECDKLKIMAKRLY